MTVTNEVFSRAARRVRRHHAQRATPSDRWLLERMWLELAERSRNRIAGRILLIGHDFGALDDVLRQQDVIKVDPGFERHWGSGLRCDEDRLDSLATEAGTIDLILACGTLDSLHDVPGALILARRALAQDGRFQAAFLGSGSLPLLRSIVHHADDRPVARMHPQIDVRAGGDLLARAGFSDPVADMETIEASYSSWDRYLGDLRANGIGNCLRERHPVSRGMMKTWRGRFEAQCDPDGRVRETFVPVYLSATAKAATIS